MRPSLENWKAGVQQKGFTISHLTIYPAPCIGAALTFWLRKAAMAKKSGQAALVPVPNLFSRAAAAPAYRLQFPRGLVMEVARGFESAELDALLQLVQRL